MTYQLADPAVCTHPTRAQRTLRLLVDDVPTVVARFALLLSRHNVELVALSVHRLDDPGTAVLLVELDTTAAMAEALTRRVAKLINVIEVSDLG